MLRAGQETAVEVIPMAFPGEHCRKASQVADRREAARDLHAEPRSPAASEDTTTWDSHARQDSPSQDPAGSDRQAGSSTARGTPSTVKGPEGDSAGRRRVFFSSQAGDDNGGTVSAARNPDCKIITEDKVESDSPAKLCRPLAGIHL